MYSTRHEHLSALSNSQSQLQIIKSQEAIESVSWPYGHANGKEWAACRSTVGGLPVGAASAIGKLVLLRNCCVKGSPEFHDGLLRWMPELEACVAVVFESKSVQKLTKKDFLRHVLAPKVTSKV